MEMEVKFELRLCKVGDEVGYFHTWEHYTSPTETISQDIPSLSPYIFGQGKVYGVVEFSNRVARVDPERIKFCDEQNAFLNAIQKQYSEDLKNGYDPFKSEVDHATKPLRT